LICKATNTEYNPPTNSGEGGVKEMKIKTIDSIVSKECFDKVRILDHEMEKAIIQTEAIMIGDTKIDGILGLDYIAKRKGINITVENGEIRYKWNDETINENSDNGIDCMLMYDDVDNVNEHSNIETFEYEDFVLYKVPDANNNHFWEFAFKWLDKPISEHIGAKRYTVKATPENRTKYDEEIQTWIELGYLIPAEEEIYTYVPINAVAQNHKLSMQVRPVNDCRYLNEHIKSIPNEGLSDPIAAISTIRRWRAMQCSDMCMLDIRKAYMQVRIRKDLYKYQGVILENGQHYMMTRLPFGLNIAPKVLRTILSKIIPNDIVDHKQYYVDDLFIPRSKVEIVQQILAKNSFSVKPPEPIETARILGLQCTGFGKWKRRNDEIPRLEIKTRKGVHSWGGKLTAHVPIAGWLRPAVSLLKRCCYANTKEEWNLELDSIQQKICDQLQLEIEKRGDPVGGDWSYNPDLDWVLYTDASTVALGCVLEIGGVIVEDNCQLRKANDIRHINLCELLAVEFGLGLVLKYIRDLEISREILINLRVDNRSVMAWLTRSEQRHWRKIKGINQKITEKTLDNIATLCKEFNIKLKVEYVESSCNKADNLTRVPRFLQKEQTYEFDPNHVHDVLVMTMVNVERSRDQFGRVIVGPDEAINVVKSLHRHEGANALWRKARKIIEYKGLRQLCQQTVRDCPECALGKPSNHREISDYNEVDDNITVPFRKVHMDILGPFGEIDGYQRLFIVTLIDSYSRFALTRATILPPTTRDAIAVFRLCYDRFHTTPDVIHTDGGSQFQSADFSHFLTRFQCQRMTSPVGVSWVNGKVERLHRIINDRLRANYRLNWLENDQTYIELVDQITREYNTTESSNLGRSPHEAIYTFEPFLYPDLKSYRKTPRTELSINQVGNERGISNDDQLPRVGQIWKVKRKRSRKSDLLYHPCRIVDQISKKIYQIQLPNNTLVKTHVRDLAELSPEAYGNFLSSEKLPEEINDRPLRNLSGRRGGRVADS
jgi:transposase InsO family protein